MATTLENAIDWGTAITPVGGVITYYFLGSGEMDPDGDSSFGFSTYEKARFREAFDVYESFLDVTFVEVGSQAAADINLSTYSANSSDLGMMYPPGEGGALEGYGYFNFNGTGWDDAPGGALEQGGFGFVTIVHELGHGFGLAHPHDNGGGSVLFPGVDEEFGDYGSFQLNQGVYTTMTYNDGWQSKMGDPPSLNYGHQGMPMAIDIAVLQAKYGANMSYRTGNDTYVVPDSNGKGTFYQAIWDAGGTDEIVYNGGRDVEIDLRAATLLVEPGGGGFVSYAKGIHGGFTIANGVVIENASGGSGNDSLHGNAADNRILGNAGKDDLFGNGGNDFLSGGNGKDFIEGNQGDDVLLGGKRKDTLEGNNGDDQLDGGKGFDILLGGSGADAFVFSSKLKSSKRDKIKDFGEGVDAIWLSQSIFKKIGGTGMLEAKYFKNGNEAKDGNDHIIYSKKKGLLIYDKNGDASGGDKVVAKLDKGTQLSHDDFIVVA